MTDLTISHLMIIDMSIAEAVQEYATTENFMSSYRAQQGMD